MDAYALAAANIADYLTAGHGTRWWLLADGTLTSTDSSTSLREGLHVATSPGLGNLDSTWFTDGGGFVIDSEGVYYLLSELPGDHDVRPAPWTDLDFVVPPENQGQIVTVSYAFDEDGSHIVRRSFDASDCTAAYAIHEIDHDDASIDYDAIDFRNSDPGEALDWDAFETIGDIAAVVRWCCANGDVTGEINDFAEEIAQSVADEAERVAQMEANENADRAPEES